MDTVYYQIDPVTGDYLVVDANGTLLERIPADVAEAALAAEGVDPNSVAPSDPAVDPNTVSSDPLPPDLPYPQPTETWQVEANNYATGNAYSTGDSDHAREAWQPGSTTAPVEDVPATTDDGSGGSGGGSGSGGGYRRRGSSGGGGGGYDYDNDGYADDGSDEPTVPRYADGSTHPYWGGEPRVPGGKFNDGEREYRDRSWMNEGPSSRSAPTNNFLTDRLGLGPKTVGGNAGGGGGGSAAYQAARANVLGKAGGLFGGAPPTSPGGGSGGAGGGGGGGGGTGEATERLRGWAGRQGFKGATLQDTLYTAPNALLPYVFPRLKTGSAGYDILSDLPMNELVMLTKGGRRGWTGGAGDQANALRNIYKDIATKPRVFDYQALSKNLFGANKNSPLGQLTKTGTPGEQAYNVQNYLGAVANASMSPEVASAYMNAAGDLTADWQSRNLRKGPRDVKPLSNYLKRRLP